MMFRPREGHDQRILSCDVQISPVPARLRYVHDVFGNSVGVVGFKGRSRELSFESFVRLEHTPASAFADLDGGMEVYTGAAPFAYSAQDLPDLAQSMQRLHPDPQGLVDQWARRFVRRAGATPLQTLLSEMTQAIYAEFKYSKRL